MRTFAMYGLFGLSSVAMAQVPQGSILAGADAAGSDSANGYAVTGTTLISSGLPTQFQGDFRAMAVGDDDRIWSLHSVTEVLTATEPSTGASESFDLTAVDSNWSDMVGTDTGRLLISTFDGDIYEVDTADGSLSLSPFTLTLTTGIELRNLAAVGNIFYASTTPTDFSSSPFVLKRFDLTSDAALSDQATSYYRGHMFHVFDNGDVLLSDNRDGPFLFRRSADNSTNVFTRSFLGFGADATETSDGSLWVLMTDDNIYRLDPNTGLDIGENPHINAATGHSTMDAFEAASLLDVQYTTPQIDNCPDNAVKTEPGVCGCDFYDIPAEEFEEPVPPGGVGCVHVTATFPASALIGTGAYVYEYATVGEDAEVWERATVAARASVGDEATIANDAIISRRASIGADSYIGSESVIERSVQIGELALIGDSVTVGYASRIPDNADIADNTAIGALVDFGTGAVTVGGRSPAPVVVARGVTFGDVVNLDSGTVIGPNCTFGNSFATGEGARIRKGVTAGANVAIGSGARIGRGVTFQGNNIVGFDADIGTNSTINLGVCVADEETVPRATTVTTNLCEEEN